MKFEEITHRAKVIRDKYAIIEKKVAGKPWGSLERTQGLVVDVGDLMRLVMAKNNLRKAENVDEQLKHELADCLWSIIIIADELGIDLENAFNETMSEIEVKKL
ncbi:MAG: MazG nucleotide pyrophosphohydrolase domain-containing protein [Patescibacteria group bacterium]|jgi:hypothetical protein